MRSLIGAEYTPTVAEAKGVWSINEVALNVLDAIWPAFNVTYDGEVLAAGPTSYWKFDETSGTVATDLVGAYNGTYSGVTLGVTGPFGSDTAISLDGTNDIVTTANPGVAGNAARTFIGWFKTTATTDAGRFVYYGSTTTGTEVCFRIEDGGANSGTVGAFRAEYNGQVATASTVVNDDAWHFVAVTLPDSATPSATKIYIDGVLETNSFTLGSTINTGGTFDISFGKDQRGGGFIATSLARWAAFDRELTATEIADIFAAASVSIAGPTFEWGFDSGFGATLEANGGPTIAISGNMGYTTALPPRESALGADYDSAQSTSSSGARAWEVGGLTIAAGSFSIGFWYEPFGLGRTMVGHDVATDLWGVTNEVDGGLTFKINATTVTWASIFANNVAASLVLSYDEANNEISLYKNGVLVSTQALTLTRAAATGPLIGEENDPYYTNGDPFTVGNRGYGQWDLIRVWEYAVAATEVSDLYSFDTT